MIQVFKKLLKYFYFSFKRFELRSKNIFIESNVSFLRTNFSEYNRVCKKSNVDRSSIGAYTYIGWNSFLANVKIGAFCSIGPYVEVIYGTHPFDYISTNPVFYSIRKQCGTSFVQKDLFQEFRLISDLRLSAIIGNDVWIGYGAKIIEGVSIGDGAVVLAGAYVTKDVQPYSIVGGVPAKHIKYRFPEELRSELLEFKWWTKDVNWIKNNASDFLNINSFSKLIDKKENI